jgi:hypothetical protein
VASSISITADGIKSEPDLYSPFVRRFVEKAALVALLASGHNLVNGKGYGDLAAHSVLR